MTNNSARLLLLGKSVNQKKFFKKCLLAYLCSTFIPTRYLSQVSSKKPPLAIFLFLCSLQPYQYPPNPRSWILWPFDQTYSVQNPFALLPAPRQIACLTRHHSQSHIDRHRRRMVSCPVSLTDSYEIPVQEFYSFHSILLIFNTFIFFYFLYFLFNTFIFLFSLLSFQYFILL